MKIFYSKNAGAFFFFSFVFIFSSNVVAQVGIGTTDPDSNALLEINASTTPGGLLLPRVALTATNSSVPLTGTIEAGMTIYNTATSGTGAFRVTPGFYYHNGSVWVRISGATDPKTAWDLTGNAGTTPNNNFLGTTDNQPLRIRTNNTNRFEFSTDGSLRSNGFGTQTQPTYSWVGRTNTGMWSQGANVVSFSTNGAERFRIPNANQVHGMNGGTAAAPFYSWNGRANTGMFSPANNTIAFSTNANERMRILSDGRVIVNSNIVFESSFNSFATGSNMAIAARAVDGSAIYGDTYGTGYGVVGLSLGEGVGVQGESLLNDGVVGYTSGTGIASGVFGLSDNQAFGGWFSTATPFLAPGNGTGIIGVMGVEDAFIMPNGSGIAANGVKTGIYASASAFETGSVNNGNAAGEFNLGANPIRGTNTIRARAKIAGYHRGAVPGGAGGNNNSNSYYGGYFEGGVNDPAYAYVGIKYNTNNDGTEGTNYKIIGNGTVSTLVNDNEGNKRILFSPEAPEILFEDYGVGQLKNGRVYIEINPLFAKSIYVSEEYPLKVFVQLEGECNGVYVTDKTADGFLVKELNGGTSNTSFSYHLVANRADDIASDGSIASKHVGLRFPYGPGPVEMTETKVVEMKERKPKSMNRKVVEKITSNTRPNVQATEQTPTNQTPSLQQQSTVTPVKTVETEKNQFQKKN